MRIAQQDFNDLRILLLFQCLTHLAQLTTSSTDHFPQFEDCVNGGSEEKC